MELSQPYAHPSTDRVVYVVDFQPESEMTENPDAHILQIRLPGFRRDRLRISYVDSKKMVEITGQKPIENSNRRIRFNQFYSIPESCEVQKIQEKFDQGVLTITMPKKFITQIPQEVAASASQAVTKISEGTLNDKEKRSLLNLGAAAMVIAALGAYITYRFTTSEKP